MKPALSRRLTLFVWLLIPAAALALYFNPLSNRFTKICTLLVVLMVWRGLLALTWRRGGLRWAVPGLTVAAGVFLLLPGRAQENGEALRGSYVRSLEQYEGSLYYWGGESRRGIDCSGLIRCGMMNGLAKTGLRTADPGLIRRALSLWWNDVSARDLGKEQAGLTKLLFQARSINEADHSRLLPGDIAVTTNGVHILAYLGEGRWIQASPGAGKVVISRVPVENDAWFQQPVNLLRWTVLAEP